MNEAGAAWRTHHFARRGMTSLKKDVFLWPGCREKNVFGLRYWNDSTSLFCLLASVLGSLPFGRGACSRCRTSVAPPKKTPREPEFPKKSNHFSETGRHPRNLDRFRAGRPSDGRDDRVGKGFP